MSIQLSASEKKDAKYVLSLNKNGKTTAMDLSDDQVYNFYKKHLEIAGLTPKKRPQFFKTIEEMREHHCKLKKYKKSLKHMVAASNDTQDYSVNVVTQLTSSDGQNFTAGAVSSVPNGTQITKVIVTLFDEDYNVLGTGVNEQFNQGISTVAVATGGFSTPMPPEGREITAYATYTYSDKTGDYLHNSSVTTVKFPSNISKTAPVISEANKKDPNHTKIKLCMNRADKDCDYNYTQSQTGPGTVVLPFAGSITYAQPIDQLTFDVDGNPINASYDLNTAATGQGGSAVTNPSGDFKFFKDPNTVISTDRKKISWNIANLRFDNTEAYGAIHTTGQDLYFIFRLTLPISGNDVTAFITNAPPDMTPGSCPQNTLNIPLFTAINGCLGRGTLVKMADGDLKAIEEIVVGDRVVSNTKGNVLVVTDTIFGREATMVEITYAGGEKLLLTEKHPVVTSKGVLLACQLEKGDELSCEKGDVKIADVKEVIYNDKVFNLLLRAEVGALGQDDTTHFANGILVGDGHMQRIYEEKFMTNKQTVLDSIHVKWHEDYLNFLKEQAK